jgi:hypothetical protein
VYLVVPNLAIENYDFKVVSLSVYWGINEIFTHTAIQ